MELALPVRPDGSSHAVGFGVVLAVHVLVGYALVTGLAQKIVDTVRAPIEARLIEEIKPPPPPPEQPKIIPKTLPRPKAPPPPFVPPPEVAVAPAPPAPTITAVTPVAPPADVQPAPPAPVVAAPPRTESVAIGVVCPTMVQPVLPRRAEQEGLSGVVRAQATIRGGKVVQVEILSSKPRGLFDSAVRNAMLQYGCQSGSETVVAVQNFEFRAE
jgi:protein TonB